MADRPLPQTLWHAIAAYLERAYAAAPPKGVQARLDQLRSADSAAVYDSPAFERGQGGRLSLRLGNRCYPHMKLCIEAAPLGEGCLFRVDTHDRHACPEEGSADYQAFCALMASNQEIAAAIEAAWAEQGLPTFKQLLRDDLARRRRETVPP